MILTSLLFSTLNSLTQWLICDVAKSLSLDMQVIGPTVWETVGENQINCAGLRNKKLQCSLNPEPKNEKTKIVWG